MLPVLEAGHGSALGVGGDAAGSVPREQGYGWPKGPEWVGEKQVQARKEQKPNERDRVWGT